MVLLDVGQHMEPYLPQIKRNLFLHIEGKVQAYTPAAPTPRPPHDQQQLLCASADSEQPNRRGGGGAVRQPRCAPPADDRWFV